MLPASVSVVRRNAARLAVLWPLFVVGLPAQEAVEGPSAIADSVWITPGPQYQAGWLRTVMTGQGYRDLWAIPIKVEVADLSTLGGGLTPVRIGGGMTTKTLHMKGADGRRYVLRSVNKYVAQGLPEELRRTPIESALQDQISAFHPSGALVVTPLVRTAGVLHAEPRLYVVPDDPRLGEFRSEFAGMLVLFEERPDEGPGETPGFAGSEKIVGTERLFEIVEESPQDIVDTRAFLKSRIIDLFVGDRDKGINNYLWARFREGETFVWRPIPRDRDQAFIRLDGALKWIVRFYEPRLVAFGEEYVSVVGLTRSAWDLDRRFLVGLDKATWDSVVAELRTELADSVIDTAVRQMPPEHYRVNGTYLAQALKKRRDLLQEAANRLYEIVCSYADIQASDQSELAVIDRLDDDHVRVQLYPRHEDAEASKRTPYFRRTFDRRQTHEIRLYLHGGADRAVVRGSSRRSIKVRIIGGGGQDELVDSSRVPGRQTYFYDAGDQTRFVRRPNTVVAHQHVPAPIAWQDRALTPDWGTAWIPAPQLTVDRDLGLFLGAGVTHFRYGFLKKPYSSKMQLIGGYATQMRRILLEYSHDFRNVRSYVHASLFARWSGIEILNFHGFGNETEAPRSRNFYKTEQQQLLFSPSAVISAQRGPEFELRAVFKMSSTDTLRATDTFISETRPYGSGDFTQVGVQVGFRVDSRDRIAAPSRGFFINAGGSYYPELLDVDRGAFGDIHGEVSTYLSSSESGNLTLAVRLAGNKVWGTVPFHEAAFVGGAKTVRGFREQRYAGDAAVYANAEVRAFLTRSFLIYPADFGVFALTDVGRVFLRGETSTKWHSAVGGGIWIAPVQSSIMVRIGVARSAERTAFYVGTGFLF